MDKNTPGTVLNDEQKKAIEFGQGPLLIIAGAGTGKTTVITERIKHLILSEKATPVEILALTFTEKAAKEMEERVDVALPYGYSQMYIGTFHSFCDTVLKTDGLHIGLNPAYSLMTESDSVKFLKEHIFDLDLKYFRPLGNPGKFIQALLGHFSRLYDEDISPAHYLKWAQNQKSKSKGQNKSDELNAVKWLELAGAYSFYENLKLTKAKFDFADLISCTLKLFRERPNILEKYQKQFKYILFDEFQDTNIAQNELIKLLAGKNANVTAVADDDQCLPPNTKISTLSGDIPIKNIKVGDQVITAVGKGYLSSSNIAHIKKSTKKARFLTFTTESGTKLEATDNHKFFCMIPGRKYGNGEDHFVYLMWCEDMGWRLGITNDIAQRIKLERSADKIIVIRHCSSLEEALFYETTYSMRYRIPRYPFKPRKGMKLTGEWLEKLYKEFDTEANAVRLAKDLGIDLNVHHYYLAGVVRGSKERLKIRLKMCTRRHRTKWAKGRLMISPKILHEVCLETSSEKAISLLGKTGIKAYKAKKGWIIRKYFANLEEAGAFAKTLAHATNAVIEPSFDIGKRDGYSRPALVMPAKNVLVGMRVPVKHGYEIVYEKVLKRDEEIRKETVYDLEIENTHNFIANGIVVHNSIYKWRGASTSNVLQFRKTYPKSKIITLTKNYRSTQEILDNAYKLIQNNNPDRLEVKEKINKRLVAQSGEKGEPTEFLHADRVENEAEIVSKKILQLIKEEKRDFSDFAILVRANNHSEPFIRSLTRFGIPYQFLGPGQLFQQPEVKELIAYLKVLVNYEDSVALYKVLCIDYFAIPPKDLASLTNYAKKFNMSLFEAMEKTIGGEPGRTNEDLFVLDETKTKVKLLTEIIHTHLKAVPKSTAGQILYDFLDRSGILKSLGNSGSDGNEKRILNISKFFNKLKSFEASNDDSSVFAVVDWIDLAMDLGESPASADFDWSAENAVNILTIHGSKGLEFPVVFVVNLVSERFPTRARGDTLPIPEALVKEIPPVGDYHLQEERRLFYVAITRAKERLYLTASDYYGDAKRQKKISPFVIETLGEEVLTGEVFKGEQLSFFDTNSPLSLPAEGEARQRRPTSSIQLPTSHVPRLITYLSYSQIDTFNFCPMHYKLKYILGIPSPSNPALSFGVTMHQTLKDFSDRLMQGEKVGKKQLVEIYERNWIKEGYSRKAHEEQMKKRGEEYLKSYLKSKLHSEIPPLAVEQPFNFYVTHDLKVGGKIDRIDKTTDGIEIIDYKTTDFSDKELPTPGELAKDLQLSIYGLAAAKVKHPFFDDQSQKVTLSLYLLDKGEKVSTTRTVEQLEKTVEEILKVRDEIQNSEFLCSGNYFCRECELKMFCEVKN